MGPDAVFLVIWMLSFKPVFSLSSFTFLKRLFSSSSLSAIRVVVSAYLWLLDIANSIARGCYFSQQSWFQLVLCESERRSFVSSCLRPHGLYSTWNSPRHVVRHFAWCTVHISLKSRVTIYSVDVFLSQFGTSLLFHVQFCCFLTCIQVSHEAGQVVWYSHLFKNFPQFVVIHTIKGFSVVNEAEVDVFLEFSCFFYDPVDVVNLISGSSAFLNPAWTSGSSQLTYYWSLA